MNREVTQSLGVQHQLLHTLVHCVVRTNAFTQSAESQTPGLLPPSRPSRHALRGGAVVRPGPCGSATPPGDGAPPDGEHEEVDGAARTERAGLLGAAAPDGRHVGAAEPAPRGGLHQPAPQGEVNPLIKHHIG